MRKPEIAVIAQALIKIGDLAITRSERPNRLAQRGPADMEAGRAGEP